MRNEKNKAGFTLIEMLLVLAVAASLLVLMLNYSTQKTDQLRRDRVALQTQQILSAALNYYVNNGKWPSCTTPPCNFNSTNGNDLQANNFVPQIVIKNPWGASYSYNTYNNNNNFFVYTDTRTTANAQTTVGQLPLGFTATTSTAPTPSSSGCPGGTGCTFVVTTVTVPGQNLNNARSINFAGLYHSGACVPAPVCPGTMTPQIFVTPAQASGTNNSSMAYPMTAFSAYATGSSSAPTLPAAAASLAACDTGSAVACQLSGSDPAGTTYWRVCLDVQTGLGMVNATGEGQNQTLLAITRCMPASEPTGSGFNVYSP